MVRPPRRLLPLFGAAEHTADAAAACVAALNPNDVLWVSDQARPPFVHCPAAHLRRRLGSSWHAVVLDLHDGVLADRLAAADGFLLAGGGLVLRFDPTPRPPSALWVHPFQRHEVGTRLEARVRRSLPDGRPAPLVPAMPAVGGSSEQTRLVDTLVAALHGPPAIHAVVAPRGRGKSTALGLALARSPGRAAVCAPTSQAAAELSRHVDLPVLDPNEALRTDLDVLAVDEAAQLPVPWLRALVARHPHAHLLFATTTGGYEGTGRGFVLRFLDALDHDPRPLHRHPLVEPIRWGANDPLEAWTRRVLLLDAEPAPVPDAPVSTATVQVLDRDALADDEQLLSDVFGLLQHAHYRTTPGDLQRLLDAPNLTVHAARIGGRVVAVNLVAREGGLDPQRCEAVRTGALRLRGHALPDTLISHCGQSEAGAMTWVRSVRIATHPALRGQGLARQLVAHVHAHHQPDGFGTLFGATEAVVRFRQRLGYRLVRLGASRGSRTGEPAAVMVRPVSARAKQLTDRLGGRLARDLPLQLALLHGDGLMPLPTGLLDALRDLPPAAPFTPEEVWEAIEAYRDGPRPLEAAAAALRPWLQASDLSDWTDAERTVLQRRVFDTRDWSTAAAEAGYRHPREAMRALKRAVQRLPLPTVDPGKD